jgi:hypothetical protein
MPEGSVRSLRCLSILLVLSFFTAVLPVAAYTDVGNYSPTMVIPTKFRLLLIDIMEFPENPVVPFAPPPEERLKPEGSTSPVRMESQAVDDQVLAAGLVPDASYSGLGRGFVQTNFDVSFDEPGRKIDNHERLTARGLFNVHVSHGFN